MFQTGHSLYALIEMIYRVKCFKYFQMVYNLNGCCIQLNTNNKAIYKSFQSCSPFRMFQTGHSMYALIEMLCRVKLFKYFQMVYNLNCCCIHLNTKNKAIYKSFQSCSPFRMLQTSHSLYALIGIGSAAVF